MTQNRSEEIVVLYFGTYRNDYSRNRILIEGLKHVGVQVIECHEQLWIDIEDRINIVKGGWFSINFLIRVVKVYLKLLFNYFKLKNYDVMVVGYPGQFDVFIGKILSSLKRKPLIWDFFMSIYLISIERGLELRNSFSIGLLRRVEKLALKLPDLIICDTQEYVNWIIKTHRAPMNKYRLIPTGADDRIFKPSHYLPQNKSFKVIYYGTFIPNHGIPYIIEAIKLLQEVTDIDFTFIGDGPDKAYAEMKKLEYGLENIKFYGWYNKNDLVRELIKADLCLGAFGKTPQSMMTVQNKIYECMAMQKPVISGDSPTIRHHFSHLEEIYLCDRDDPQSLANGIRYLKENYVKLEEIARKGYLKYKENFTIDKNGEKFQTCIVEVLRK